MDKQLAKLVRIGPGPYISNKDCRPLGNEVKLTNKLQAASLSAPRICWLRCFSIVKLSIEKKN